MRLARPRVCTHSGWGTDHPRAARAFTLVELLVVIVVIGLLIGALGLVGVRVYNAQKVRYTEAIMKNARAAIDQFALENPLRGIYDSVGTTRTRTFGPFPPYQIHGAQVGSVRWAVEPYHPLMNGSVDYLSARLALDFGPDLPHAEDYVRFGYEFHGQADDPDETMHSDMRALYAYLAVYSPGVLDQVPPDALKPLSPLALTDPTWRDYINPSGRGPAPGVDGNNWIDVLGIHDAWGVPLDYFLYVKLGPGVRADGLPGWVVLDRQPALRSRGISRENYDAKSGGNSGDWVFSDPFPAATCTGVQFDGDLVGNPTGGTTGWVRAIGLDDFYQPSGPRDLNPAYGFTPEP